MAFENADAALDARSPAVGTSKASGVSHLFLFGREWSVSRQSDGADVEVVCGAFVVEGEEGAVGGEQARRLAETRLVMLEAVR